MDKDNKQAPCEIFTPHSMRKLCKVCYNRLEDHPLTEEDVDSIRTHLKVFLEHPEIKPHPQYAWIPSNCPINRLDEYFKKFPEDKIPWHKSAGQADRLKRLVYQIPLHDTSIDKCRFLDPKYHEDFKNYVENLQSIVLKIGKVKERTEGMPVQCPTCLLVIDLNELVVSCSDDESQLFHPSCFVCFQCRELLADLIHCTAVDGIVFCLRHYNENVKKRCHTCDELIFSTQYAFAGNKYYHKEHLLCFSCDGLMNGTKGFAKDGEIYCASCYEAQFCNECTKCQKKITVESRHITFRDNNWHDECFTCAKCESVLSDGPFEIVEGEKFLCSTCYQKDYAPKCEGCKECLEPQTQVVTYEKKVYHVACFKCVDCLQSIGTDRFVPHKNRVYCKPCHLRNFGVRCFRCKYSITDDRALMYNKQPYHEDCFICHMCSTKIARRPFKNIEDNWYCLKCYGNKFCKNCHTCDKPILLGTDDDIMYSYQDFRWHASCFICSTCNNSLADKVFMMSEKVLVCKPCFEEFEDKEREANASTENKETQQESALSS